LRWPAAFCRFLPPTVGIDTLINFSGADLRRANFTGVKVDGAVILSGNSGEMRVSDDKAVSELQRAALSKTKGG
jgi:uncharacterized protein YjbI with pentapeptide repeats